MTSILPAPPIPEKFWEALENPLVPGLTKADLLALLEVFGGERPPRQEPLFILPPPATPIAWAIEFRWRETHDDLGMPRDTETWHFVGVWRCRTRLQRQMRRLRYTDRWKRKSFRYRATEWNNATPTWNGPPEPKIPESPASGASQPAKKPIWLLSPVYK